MSRKRHPYKLLKEKVNIYLVMMMKKKNEMKKKKVMKKRKLKEKEKG